MAPGEQREREGTPVPLACLPPSFPRTVGYPLLFTSASLALPGDTLGYTQTLLDVLPGASQSI